MDWLLVTRILTHYVASGLAVGVVIVEVTGWLLGAPLSHAVPYNYVLLIVFSLLTASMIGVCVWIVFLWDLDRLFFKLEAKIDTQVAAAVELKADESRNDITLI
ncbi:MAG: hypothetical protein J2P53_07460, partial [Bradyrhizobiaceae bacterium]|nr:hypothetical protein [Bradyrhizobiaceae bacterium]